MTTNNTTSEIKHLLDAILDSVILVDPIGNIVHVNKATCDLLGYTEIELAGQTIRLVLQEEVRYPVEKRIEKNYRKKDGTLRPVQFTAGVIRNDSGVSQGWLLVAQASTESKQAQEALIRKTNALEASNKELDQFAYVVSHDLKAPLRAIANLSQWIEDDLSESMSADTRKQMGLLRGRVKRMDELISGVLEYSRASRVADQMERVDTKALLNDIIDGLPLPAGYTITAGPGMPCFSTARTKLGQVFGNLLSNAIKYRARDDGRATVSVEDEGDFYAFTVMDDGIGIAPEYHEKVFIIFQTLAARDKVESTGIGLTLVKKIVESVGGKITLTSQAGQGAAFRFTWPKVMEERAMI